MHFWWIFIFLYILSLNIIDVYMYDDWWGQTKYVTFNSAKLQFVICLVNKNMFRKPIVYQKYSLSVHHSQIEIRATVFFFVTYIYTMFHFILFIFSRVFLFADKITLNCSVYLVAHFCFKQKEIVKNSNPTL